MSDICTQESLEALYTHAEKLRRQLRRVLIRNARHRSFIVSMNGPEPPQNTVDLESYRLPAARPDLAPARRQARALRVVSALQAAHRAVHAENDDMHRWMAAHVGQRA